jgi:plasmid stability protein
MLQRTEKASKHQIQYVLMPRTTLTLDDDVAAELERRRRVRGTSLKAEVNELLRAGMRREEESTPAAEPFQTPLLSIGRPLLESFDDISEVLELAEGDEHR